MAETGPASDIEALFAAMLPPAMAARFTGLLKMDPKRWGKIDPWRVWEQPPYGESHVSELRDRASLSSPVLRPFLDQPAVVLRCGHSSPPSLGREPLRGVLDNSSHVLEGFISVVRGKLGLAMNHDGGVCILQKP